MSHIIKQDTYTFANGFYQIILEMNGGDDAISVRDLKTQAEYTLHEDSINATSNLVKAIIAEPAALHEFVGRAFGGDPSMYTYCFNDGCMLIGVSMPPYTTFDDGLTIRLYPTPPKGGSLPIVDRITNNNEFYATFLTSLITMLEPTEDDRYVLILFATETFDRARLLHVNAASYNSVTHYESEIKICMKMIPVRCMYAGVSKYLRIKDILRGAGLSTSGGDINMAHCSVDCLWARISTKY
jgi:hypothetical protein